VNPDVRRCLAARLAKPVDIALGAMVVASIVAM
jgi:hypothetical protein